MRRKINENLKVKLVKLNGISHLFKLLKLLTKIQRIYNVQSWENNNTPQLTSQLIVLCFEVNVHNKIVTNFKILITHEFISEIIGKF